MLATATNKSSVGLLLLGAALLAAAAFSASRAGVQLSPQSKVVCPLKKSAGKCGAFPNDCCFVTEAAAKASGGGVEAGQCVASTAEVCTRVRADADDAAAAVAADAAKAQAKVDKAEAAAVARDKADAASLAANKADQARRTAAGCLGQYPRS